MKRFINYILAAFLGILVVFNACTPETLELGEVISKDDLKYIITQNEEDPNMVILESLTPEVTPHWITPIGRSTRVIDTVKLAFPGEYTFAYGVQSAGGYIQAEDEVVNITTTNFDYINDPLWELISGGVGNSKTWVLDLFPQEEAPNFTKFFNGPLYFYDTFYKWENVTDGQDVDYPDGTPSDEAWGYWAADWAGNGSWLFGGSPAEDYGTMTFDLIDGANLTVNHKVLGRQETGTYTLNADNHTLSTTDAYMLHDEGRDGQVVNWGDVRILSLTENTMQLAVVRDQALSGEGPTLLCYNYVSKEYSDNWVPEDVPDPEPELPDGWEDDISSTTNTTIKWVLSPETPFNWANLDGSLKNTGWVSPDTYDDWTGMNADVPETYADFSLTMNSQDNTIAMVLPDGTESSGTYELDEKGIYTFTGVTPFFTICNGWVNLYTTDENQWRILSIEKGATGAVTSMWVGALSTDKPEYMCWKLVPEVAGGDDALANIKNILTANTWKLDSERTYEKEYSWGWEQGPIIFSDFATWAWNPEAGTHYAAGEAGVDYGSMKFDMNGTVTVQQHRRIYTYVDEVSGETLERHGDPQDGDVLVTDDVIDLSGSWSIDLDNGKLLMTVGVVHPWTCDYYVLNWGDIDIHRIEDGALLLKVMRDAERSGEDAFAMTYVFVPGE